jgi:hypothetical protein
LGDVKVHNMGSVIALLIKYNLLAEYKDKYNSDLSLLTKRLEFLLKELQGSLTNCLITLESILSESIKMEMVIWQSVVASAVSILYPAAEVLPQPASVQFNGELLLTTVMEEYQFCQEMNGENRFAKLQLILPDRNKLTAIMLNQQCRMAFLTAFAPAERIWAMRKVADAYRRYAENPVAQQRIETEMQQQDSYQQAMGKLQTIIQQVRIAPPFESSSAMQMFPVETYGSRVASDFGLLTHILFDRKFLHQFLGTLNVSYWEETFQALIAYSDADKRNFIKDRLTELEINGELAELRNGCGR